MKRTLLAIISILSIFAQTPVSAEKGLESAEDFSKAQLQIKFYDRTMYYPDMVNENPVYVQVSITNGGTETLRFKLADDRMFSMDFKAYTIKNTELKETEALKEKRSTNQTVYFRELSVEPGETYSFVENVKEYLQFKEPSIYYLEMVFYPELYKSRYLSMTSNRLSLEIRPSPAAVAGTLLPVEDQTAAILKPRDYPPDKVVEQTIRARQKSLWDQYFLYMDVEAMMRKSPSVDRKFRQASPVEQARMIEDYKAGLMKDKIDREIVAVPEKFVIENTNYNATDGSVTVTEWFRHSGYYEKKTYVYKLRLRDGIWQIYNFTVKNLGTE